MTLLDGLQQIVGSVIDTVDELSEALGVRSPLDDDLVKSILGLEVADILADLLNVLPASLVALQNIIGTILLVGSNEVWIIDGWKWSHLGHFLTNQLLESWLENSSSVHGLGKVHSADVPTTNDEIVRVNHWKHIVEWNVDILGGLCISSEFHGGAHDNGAVVVGSTRTLTSLPCQPTTVRNDTGSDSGTIVTTPSDQHHTSLWDLAIDLEVVDRLLWSCNILALAILFDGSGTIGVLGLDLGVGIDDIWRVDGKEIFVLCNIAVAVPVRVPSVSVWCHIDNI